MEGLLLAYVHLLCGHAGWVKMYMYLKDRFFFDNMKEKSRTISSTCQLCVVSNPSTRRKSPMKGVLSAYPFEVITADLLEVENLVGRNTKKILVIADYHSKAIFAFPLTSTTGTAFIANLKDFLMMTGMVSRFLIVDNASIFSNKEVLAFLHMSGCLLYTSPSPRDRQKSRMPSSA